MLTYTGAATSLVCPSLSSVRIDRRDGTICKLVDVGSSQQSWERSLCSNAGDPGHFPNMSHRGAGAEKENTEIYNYRDDYWSL